jgi:hypothetical protein
MSRDRRRRVVYQRRIEGGCFSRQRAKPLWVRESPTVEDCLAASGWVAGGVPQLHTEICTLRRVLSVRYYSVLVEEGTLDTDSTQLSLTLSHVGR